MPTKIFLPETRITYHPIFNAGDTTTHVWVRTDAIEGLANNQEQFIKALQIVFEQGLNDGWIKDNLQLINKIRKSIGLKELE